MTALRVAVAGPNSALGPSVLKHLQDAGMTITALTRDASKVQLGDAIQILEADYSSVEALAPALKDQDAVVDLLNDRTLTANITLLDAAVKAGVKHIIPGSFGLDFQNDFMRTVPLVAGKVKLEDRVIALGKSGQIKYTIIETGMFLDWALSKGYLLPLDGGEFMVFDGGEAKQSLSLLDDIGRAVATALVKREDPAVTNKILFINSTATSPKQILAYAEEAAGESKQWDLVSQNAEETYEKSVKAFGEGSRDPATFRGFLAGYIKAGTNLFKRVDNELLGVKTITKQELKDIVATFVRGGSGASLPYKR